VQPDRRPVDLPWEEFCLVRIDSRHVTSHGAFISNDQWQSVRLTHQRLRALGYQRVGLAVGAADEDGTGGLHLAAWLVEQHALPADQRVPALLFPHRASHRDVAHLLRDWVSRHEIDAVACNWTNIRGLLRAAGVSVPREVACACLCLSHALPGLAGIISQLDQVGKDAVTLLVNLLHGVPDTSHPTLSYVEGTWHTGASAPPRPR
jgi:LacI family transcriptional regulator